MVCVKIVVFYDGPFFVKWSFVKWFAELFSTMNFSTMTDALKILKLWWSNLRHLLVNKCCPKVVDTNLVYNIRINVCKT